MPFTSVELCAGGGGQALGLELAGFQHKAVIEYEPQFCTTLRTNRPHWNILEMDIREFNAKPYEGIDLLAAGVPCPPFSIAGKQLGQEDERDMFPAALGHDYSISPDIVILRQPMDDERINSGSLIVGEQVAEMASLRKKCNPLPILHASVSCKFTLRSDRSQNARTEALNLIRNRKGKLPHVVVVTAECLPSRLASLALGTGDFDCLYHFALPELKKAVINSSHDDSEEMLMTLCDGKRIKDISDLPLDLAV